MRFAIVSATGAVITVIVADDGDPCPSPGADLVQVPDGLAVDSRWSYIAGAFVAPPPTVGPSRT